MARIYIYNNDLDRKEFLLKKIKKMKKDKNVITFGTAGLGTDGKGFVGILAFKP